MYFEFWIFCSESNPTTCNFELQNETCLQYVRFLQRDQTSVVLYIPLFFFKLLRAFILQKDNLLCFEN